MEDYVGENHGPGAPRMFDNGAQEYIMKYGGGVEHLAKIGEHLFRGTVLGLTKTPQHPRTTSIQPTIHIPSSGMDGM